jgi:hypothetical protein
MLARKYGQLGNRLRRTAHLIAASLEHGHTLVDLSFAEYADEFESTRHDLLCRFPARRGLLPHPRWLRAAVDRLATLALRIVRLFPVFGSLLRVVVWRDVESEYRMDSQEFADLASRTRMLLLEGWMFRTSAVQRHVDVIRAHFAPARHHAEKIEALVAGLRARADLVVGVHVRRGDYASFLGGRYFWPVSAYADLMRRVMVLFPGRRIVFLVCSDQPLDLAAFDDLPCAAGTDHAVSDLYALARCDYLLGPPSTFTVWASFYGRVPLWSPQRPNDEATLDAFEPRLP